jgi:hypothetical protein
MNILYTTWKFFSRANAKNICLRAKNNQLYVEKKEKM